MYFNYNDILSQDKIIKNGHKADFAVTYKALIIKYSTELRRTLNGSRVFNERIHASIKPKIFAQYLVWYGTLYGLSKYYSGKLAVLYSHAIVKAQL